MSRALAGQDEAIALARIAFVSLSYLIRLPSRQQPNQLSNQKNHVAYRLPAGALETGGGVSTVQSQGLVDSAWFGGSPSSVIRPAITGSIWGSRKHSTSHVVSKLVPSLLF